ncbi:MAG: response regulator [Candidatus Hodarchaeota archaeon]
MKIIAKILIVDDDRDIMDLFEQFLTLGGHNIAARAFNGVEAINIFKNLQNKPDIVIMDHRMPLKNGLETTKELIKINPESKIIFVSADYTVRNEAFEVGAIDFLEKPIDFNTLNAMIEKYSSIKNEAI